MPDKSSKLTKVAIACLATALATGTIVLAQTADDKQASKQTDTRIDTAPSLPAAVKAVIGAYGGSEALRLRRFAALRLHATIETDSGISSATNTFQCLLLEKGDRLRAEMTMLGLPLVLAYDGKNSWLKYGDWVSPGSPSFTEQLSEQLRHGLHRLADLAAPGAKIEMQPRQSIGSGSVLCDVFRLTGSDGTTDTFFADPVTHLIVRDDYTALDHELGMTTNQSVEYSDYRMVAGSPEPFHSVQFSGGRKKSDTAVADISIADGIDDAAFAMPPESYIAGLKDAPIVLPFEYSGNQIVVHASIDNGSEQRFIIDTGASQSVLDQAAAGTLGPHPAGTFAITAGSKAVPLAYTKIPSLNLGGLTLHDIPAFIKDLSELNDHPAGLIGANVLRRFRVTIDFENGKLILADPRTPAASDNNATTIIPAVSAFGGTALLIKGEVGGGYRMNFLVDTGASFNNIPQSLAKPFFNGPLAPIGSIFGLDGQRINIASIRCNSLKLGATTIAHPIFTVTPDGGNTGLFSASSMGILGNPIWSQFKTTIDYRNERIILEKQPGKDKLRDYLSRLDAIRQDYLRSKDADEALKRYRIILTQARADKQKEAEALTLSGIATCYTGKFDSSKESRYLDTAGKLYERASKTANESYSRSTEGQVLAQWALMYLNWPRTMRDITTAQELIGKALQKAPMEPNIFAAFGASLLHAGKPAEAETVLNRALVLDPANWQALWSKYRLCQDEQRLSDRQMVAAQLKCYYPSYPDVLELVNRD